MTYISKDKVKVNVSLEERWLSAFKHFIELYMEFYGVFFLYTRLIYSNGMHVFINELYISKWRKSRIKLDVSTVEALS